VARRRVPHQAHLRRPRRGEGARRPRRVPGLLARGRPGPDGVGWAGGGAATPGSGAATPSRPVSPWKSPRSGRGPRCAQVPDMALREASTLPSSSSSSSMGGKLPKLPEGPRERALDEGMGTLSDADLIAILLGTGLAGRPVGLVAAGLLEGAGGLD